VSAVHIIDQVAPGRDEDRPGDRPVIDLTVARSAVRPPAPGQCTETDGCRWLAAIAVLDTETGTVRWCCADHAIKLIRDHGGTVQAVDVSTPGAHLGPETIGCIVSDLHTEAGVPSVVVPDGGPFRPETGTGTAPVVPDGTGTGTAPETGGDEDRCGDCAGTGLHADRDGSVSGVVGLPVVCECMAAAADMEERMPDRRELVASWLASERDDLRTRLAAATQLAEGLAPVIESLAAVMREATTIAGSTFPLMPGDALCTQFLDETGAQALGAALDRLSSLAWVG